MKKLLEMIKSPFAKTPVFGGYKVEMSELSSGSLDKLIAIAEMVREFHTLFQHPLGAPVTNELLELRAKLITEEAVDEGIVEVEAGNIDGILDAAGDSLYVMAGAMIALRDGFYAAARADKKIGDLQDRFLTFLTSGKSYRSDFREAFEQCGTAAHSLRALQPHLNPNSGTGLNDDLETQVTYRNSMGEMYLACHEVMAMLEMGGVSPVELVRVIHESNMTKLWASDDAVRKDQVERCKYDKADLGFRAAEGRDAYIGYSISTGKILKCPDYTECDLGEFVDMVVSKGFLKGLTIK